MVFLVTKFKLLISLALPHWCFYKPLKRVDADVLNPNTRNFNENITD